MLCLKVDKLTKSFSNGWGKKKKVLDEVSFLLPKGSVTGFVGANGSGKTTTLKCILGFIYPEQGEIQFFDEYPLCADVKKRIGYLSERPYYYDYLSAQEFLKFHWDLSTKDTTIPQKNQSNPQKKNKSSLKGNPFQEAMDLVLKKVNLEGVENRRLRNFSKGMLQRIGMAQALIHRPEFLVLDEPMSGLDPDGRLLIKEIIKEEKKAGTNILMSSHLLADVEELCTDLLIIDKGKILFSGPTEEFMSSQDKSVTSLEVAFRKRINRDKGIS